VSDPRTPSDAEKVLRYVEQASAAVEIEEELEKLLALPAEEREALAKAEGVSSEQAMSVLERAMAAADAQGAAGTAKATNGTNGTDVAPVPPVASLAAAREKRANRGRVVAFLAIAAAAAAVAYVERAPIVAWFSPGPAPTPSIVPPPVPTAPPEPAPEVLADVHLKKAVDLCAKHYYGECQDEYDAALALYPAVKDGPDAHTVQSALAAWETHRSQRNELRAKPGTAWWEKALRPEPKK
jgi:hypothetical protein